MRDSKSKRGVFIIKFDDNGMLMPQRVKYKIAPEEEMKEMIRNIDRGRYMKKIEIFDIDGCICENFFPNLNENADIDTLRTRILETKLFPEFIKYHRIISKYPGLKSYFLTGRRAKDFENETLKQLEPLKIKEKGIIFFPDEYSHSKIRYNNFKIFNILNIAAKNQNSKIKIFDDLDVYIPRLMSLGLDLKIQGLRFYLVKNPAIFWKSKIKKENGGK